jgi:hypothetical protein
MLRATDAAPKATKWLEGISKKLAAIAEPFFRRGSERN